MRDNSSMPPVGEKNIFLRRILENVANRVVVVETVEP